MSRSRLSLHEEAARKSLELATRRHFLRECRTGLGMMALGALMQGCDFFGRKDGSAAAAAPAFDPSRPMAPRVPQFAARAKSVIFLHMAGAPSQLELFDYKPDLHKLDGQDCPASFLEGKKFAFIRAV